MKFAAICIVILIAGYLLGGWGPNAELKKMRDELSTVRAQLTTRSTAKQSAIQGIKQILDIPAVPEKRWRRPEEEIDATATNAVADTEIQASTADERRTRRRRGGFWRQNRDKPFKEQIEKAADMWNVRSELARDSFVTNADLNEPQAIQFDVLIKAMNIRIEAGIRELVELIKDEGISGEEAGIRIINDITAAMVITYEALNHDMPKKWRENAGEKFNLSSLIDPRVALPLADVEDQLDFQR